jgi:hypothetical protein
MKTTTTKTNQQDPIFFFKPQKQKKKTPKKKRKKQTNPYREREMCPEHPSFFSLFFCNQNKKIKE